MVRILDGKFFVLETNSVCSKFLEFPRDLKKAMEHEGDDDTHCNWYAWVRKKPGRVENRRMNRDYPNYSIGKIVRILKIAQETWEELLSLRL